MSSCSQRDNIKDFIPGNQKKIWQFLVGISVNHHAIVEYIKLLNIIQTV